MQLTMTTLAATILLTWILPTQGLLGYDCRGEGLNITSLSLTDIAECQVDDLEPKTEEVYLQLLQLNEFDHTRAIQCRVEIDRTIYYCGMHAHVSVVANGKHEYIQDTTGEACRRTQETGIITFGNRVVIEGLKRNSTTSRSATLAGLIEYNGNCKGTTFSDPYGTWDNVVVQASIRVTLKDFSIPIKFTTNEVILPSGTRCKATSQECHDADGTKTYWETTPKDSCNFNQYNILYEGNAHKLTPPPGQENALTIYTVTTNEATFALAKSSTSNICGYKLIHTEHPKLFLLESPKHGTFKSQGTTTVDNLDIFTYVNSKFVYIERHMKTQITQLYKDIMAQKCAIEKQVLENALSLSSIAPDQMAYRLMKSPGYTAVTAGEVIHLIKCIPVTCRIRQTERCYNELPVSHGNNSYFLIPRSRILSKTGTLRECNEVLPPMFRVEGAWYRMMPRAVESLPPPIIRPLTKPKWKYINPSNLATSGIYSADDLERLKNHIMFPIEKPSMLNTIARGAMGETIPAGSISLYNMLDEKTLEKIAESTGAKIWKGFISFGSASAGVLSIILLVRLARVIVDSIIRGYALHTVYGWSIHLLGAVWSSVTHLLMHLGRRQQQGQPKNGPAEEEDSLEVLVHSKNNGAVSDGETSNEQNKEQISINNPRDFGELNKYLHATTKI